MARARGGTQATACQGDALWRSNDPAGTGALVTLASHCWQLSPPGLHFARVRGSPV